MRHVEIVSKQNEFFCFSFFLGLSRGFILLLMKPLRFFLRCRSINTIWKIDWLHLIFFLRLAWLSLNRCKRLICLFRFLISTKGIYEAIWEFFNSNQILVADFNLFLNLFVFEVCCVWFDWHRKFELTPEASCWIHLKSAPSCNTDLFAHIEAQAFTCWIQFKTLSIRGSEIWLE